MAAGRIAVFGDVGGHHDALLAQLVALGMDPVTLELPDGLTVVQVGDLIHRGPDSAGVIALVDRIMVRNPGRWVQLMGNHEELYVALEPRFVWVETLPAETAPTIRRWWVEGSMQIAAAIDSPEGEWLVTHAGLTEPLWRSMRAPRSARIVAEGLNAMARSNDIRVRKAGDMLGNGVDRMAGPIWASTATEVVPSWLAAGDMPWHQVHGHSTLVDWWRRRPRVGGDILAVSGFDFERRFEMTAIGGRDIVGIDPSHGRQGSRNWAPLLIEGGSVISRQAGASAAR